MKDAYKLYYIQVLTGVSCLRERCTSLRIPATEMLDVFTDLVYFKYYLEEKDCSLDYVRDRYTKLQNKIAEKHIFFDNYNNKSR